MCETISKVMITQGVEKNDKMCLVNIFKEARKFLIILDRVLPKNLKKSLAVFKSTFG